MNREKRRNRIKPEWLLLTGLLALALAARLLPGQRIVDDAYITFRYARNLITGRGFVYNPGEHVLGTTTPLYTVLLAGLALVTGSYDFPALAMGINAVSGATAVGLLYVLDKRLAEHQAPALGAALLWALAPYSVTFAIGGMETDLTIALLLTTANAHLSGKPRAMAVLSGLALLARPDTAILVGLLWLDQILAQRTRIMTWCLMEMNSFCSGQNHCWLTQISMALPTARNFSSSILILGPVILMLTV